MKVTDDEWLSNVQRILGEETGRCTNESFIGSCCELRKNRNNQTNTHYTEQIPQLVNKSDNNHPFLDGCLYFPEFNLFVDSPNCHTDTVDIHGLAEEEGHYDGVWHCVPCLETVLMAKDKLLHPKPISIEEGDCKYFHFVLGLNNIQCLGIDEGGCSVDVYIFNQQTTFDSTIWKGSNNLTPEMIVGGRMFKPKPFAEASIILGRMSSSSTTMPLLLFRFHRPYSESLKMSNAEQIKLYNTIITKISHSGYECMRRGGSSGHTELNQDFFKFIHTSGSFPRKAGAVKFFRKKLKWVCIYRPTTTNKMVSFTYSTPRRGGQFQVSTEDGVRFKVFKAMVEMKVFTAFVLQELSQELDISIAPSSVETEIKEMRQAWKVCQSDKGQAVSLLTHQSWWTLVQHPVGFHRDVFKKKSKHLETKCVFTNGNMAPKMGRGGQGVQCFAFAVLDN